MIIVERASFRKRSSQTIDSMSRWFVGSSMSSTSGVPRSTCAIETRIFQPPANRPNRQSAIGNRQSAIGNWQFSLKPYLYYSRSTIRDEPDFLIEPFAPHAALRAVNAGDSLCDCNGTVTGRGTTADSASVGG